VSFRRYKWCRLRPAELPYSGDVLTGSSMRSDPVSPSIVRSVRAQDGEELNPWGDGIHVMLGPRLDGLTEVVQVVNDLRCEELTRVTSLKTG